MGMRQQAMKEMARREMARRQSSVNDTPNIVEETHDDVSIADRAIIKNFGQDPEKSARYLKKNNPHLDTRVWDGRVLVKSKKDKDWNVLDPDTGFFSTDILNDATDIAYDVGSGVVEGAGAIAAGMATMNPLAAMGTNAALGAGSETLRQGIGMGFGVNDEINGGDVALVGGLSGLLPMVPGAVMKGARGAKSAIKGTAKFLTGADDKAIARMQQSGGEELLQKVEDETVSPMLKAKYDQFTEALSESQKAQMGRVMKLRESLNIEDDNQLLQVLKAEKQAIEDQAAANSGQLGGAAIKKMDNLSRAMNDITETSEVRAQIKNVGMDDKELLRQSSFPESMSMENLESMTPEINDRLQGVLGGLKQQYEALGTIGDDVSLQKVKGLYKEAADQLRRSGNSDDTSIANIIEKDFQKRFTKANPEFGVNNGITSGSPKKVIEKADSVNYGEASTLKNRISDDAYKQTKAIQSGVSLNESSSALVSHLKKAERILNEDMQKASQSLKGDLDPKYVEILDTMKHAKKYFGDPAKAQATIKQAQRPGDDGKRVLAEIKKIDAITGTNYADLVEKTITATAKTRKGMNQAQLMNEAGAYVTQMASKGKNNKDLLIDTLKDKYKNPEGMVSLINQYKNKSNIILNENVDKLDKEFGDGVGDSVSDIVEKLGFIEAFGDSAKTGVKELSEGQASNTTRGLLQSLAWQTPLGAGGAQIAGAAGKAIGDKLPIKQMLRKRLPQYFKGKEAINKLSDGAKDRLEKKVMSTIFKRRDVIRELSKKMMTVDERG
jgi:hypothetical protein